MARDISGIRERRRSRARVLNHNQEAPVATQNTNPQVAPQPEAPVIPLSRSARFKAFFSKLFSKKDKKEVKIEKPKKDKIKHQLTKSSFKPLVFTIYILVFFSLIIALFIYIVKQESKYETKNKRLITTPTKPAHKEEEKVASPLISDEDENKEGTESKPNSMSQVFSSVIDNQTYTLDSVISNNLKAERFDLGGFLNFIKNNRANFCKYAEQSRMAYIFANGEVRDYSNTSYPLPNNKFDYANCMSTSAWKESELFSLYQNIYEDFINTQTDDGTLLQKLMAAKNYQMNVNFNPVRDFPQSLSGALLSENDFSQLISENYANQILLCDYSQKFSKTYDQFVSKRSGSLRPISNCYSDNMNLQEAYVQYVFYYNYIQPNSKEINANLLNSALIPNYAN